MTGLCAFCSQRMDDKALETGTRWCTPCCRECRTCGKPIGEHTWCKVCGDALEWEGRGRSL